MERDEWEDTKSLCRDSCSESAYTSLSMVSDQTRHYLIDKKNDKILALIISIRCDKINVI